MGYYVHADAADLLIKKEDFQSCYKAMCKLNDYDNLKRGGGWGGECSSDDPRPAGLTYHPAKWFSWMDPNYPETIATFHQMLLELGFEPEYDGDENLISVNYSDKSGQEELFFRVIAPWVAEGSSIVWRGEDGAVWRWYFTDGNMTIQEPMYTWLTVNHGAFTTVPNDRQLVECWSAGQA